MESILRSSLRIARLIQTIGQPAVLFRRELNPSVVVIKRWQHFERLQDSKIKLLIPITIPRRNYIATTQSCPMTSSYLLPSKCGESSDASLPILSQHQKRCFHAAGSKVKYMDFRHRLRTTHLRLHLLIIRRQKMKKHRRRKFRRKFKCLLAKQRLKREIAKEKSFRVELLSMIRRAETFDPKEYALKKIAEINNKPREQTREKRLEELKELIRVNRYQVDYIKPKHKRADWVDVKV